MFNKTALLHVVFLYTIKENFQKISCVKLNKKNFFFTRSVV